MTQMIQVLPGISVEQRAEGLTSFIPREKFSPEQVKFRCNVLLYKCNKCAFWFKPPESTNPCAENGACELVKGDIGGCCSCLLWSPIKKNMVRQILFARLRMRQ